VENRKQGWGGGAVDTRRARENRGGKKGRVKREIRSVNKKEEV